MPDNGTKRREMLVCIELLVKEGRKENSKSWVVARSLYPAKAAAGPRMRLA
jgi:hypothetical protein